MFWDKGGRQRCKPGRLTAFIDEGSEIEGKYSFTGTVMINGKFKGEIISTGTLIVGEKATIRATIQAAVVLINGEVTGNVSATERVELHGEARLQGDVDAPKVAIEDGVLFDGQCRMANAKRAESEGGPDLSVVPMTQ